MRTDRQQTDRQTCIVIIYIFKFSISSFSPYYWFLDTGTICNHHHQCSATLDINILAKFGSGSKGKVCIHLFSESRTSPPPPPPPQHHHHHHHPHHFHNYNSGKEQPVFTSSCSRQRLLQVKITIEIILFGKLSSIFAFFMSSLAH